MIIKMDPNAPTQAVNQATSSTIQTYNSTPRTSTASGTFPKFVAEHYHKNRGSSHGDTMKNVASQYKNTTFYK